MRRPAEPKLIVGFLPILAALIVNAVVSSANMDTVSRNRQSIAHTHEVVAEMEDIRFPGKQATALALLANELLSNAIKHGKGVVHLTMVADYDRNMLEMRVTDNGPGFAAGFDPQEEANTGLELIVGLAQWDLHGELEFGTQAGGGGEVRLRMPLSEPATHAVIRQETGSVPTAPRPV